MDVGGIKYRKGKEMLSKERIKLGSIIHLPDIDYFGDGEGRQKKIMRQYRVLYHYAHWCLLENSFGIRRGVTNAELMQMGIVNQKIL